MYLAGFFNSKKSRERAEKEPTTRTLKIINYREAEIVNKSYIVNNKIVTNFMSFPHTFIAKEDFRLRYGIPRGTFRRYLSLAEPQMPGQYSKYQKYLTPAQAAFLIRHLCLEPPE